MTQKNGKNLPQIEYFYDGYIYPFIGDTDLKTLINWRIDKLNSDFFMSYNKDARNTYFEHLSCIEQCIRILFSNPSPEFSLHELAKKQKNIGIENAKANEQAQLFLDRLTAKDREDILKLADKF